MEREKLVGALPKDAKSFNLQVVSCNTKTHKLWLYGVNTNGHSVAYGLRDFKPVFNVRIKGMDVEVATEELKAFLCSEFKDQEPFDEIEHITRQRAIGAAVTRDKSKMVDPTKDWDRKKYNLLKVTCANIYCYSKMQKMLAKSQWNVYDDNDLPNQFIQSTGIAYQTWMNVTDHIEVSDTESAVHNCNLEAHIDVKQCKKSDDTLIPRTLKCFFSLIALSRDGTIDLKNRLFHPNAQNRCDRMFGVCLTYVWSDNPVPVHQVIYTTIPSTRLNTNFCIDEPDLIEQVNKSIRDFDPDTIFHFPDTFDSLVYFAQRAKLYDIALDWERQKGRKCYLTEDKLFCNTRTFFDLRAPIRKKASVLLEAYNLRTISCHKDIRKKPESGTFKYSPKDYPKLMRTEATRKILLDELLQDNNLMVALERDCNLRLEYANISKISNCPLYTTVSGGEQIRVFNKLSDMYYTHGFYCNKDKLLRQHPVKFAISKRPPTFADLDEPKVTLDLRAKCHEQLRLHLLKMGEKALKVKHKAHDPFAAFRVTPESDSDEDEQKDEQMEDEDVAEGGNVMHPSPKFWEEPIFVVDFASLYPSVMIGFHISYENIVMDEKYLDVPGVPYIYIAISKYETVAVVDADGIMGKMLQMFIAARSVVKKKMAVEKDPFIKTNFNKQQESLKVICNATYGFCGAESKGALLAMKEVMYMVTSLGRFLQKCVGKYLGEPAGVPIVANVEHGNPIVTITPGYELPAIYGDTDSLFLNPGHFRVTAQTIHKFTVAIGKKYHMGQGFNWDHVVTHWKTQRKSVDITNLDIELQVNAILFVIFHKLAHECTGLFRSAVSLEFENAVNVWMGWVKKHYFGRKWAPDSPHQPEVYDDGELSLKITGMQCKTRAWCLFTRKVLKQIMLRFAEGRPELARDICIAGMEKLAAGEVPVDQLQISCMFKGFSKYQGVNFKQVQIALKMQQRHRYCVQEKTRVSFVIIKGSQDIAFRAETPEFVMENKLELDLVYYLKKQFCKPVKNLFILLPDLIDFDHEFDRVLSRVVCKQKNIGRMEDILCGKSRVLNISDLKARSQASAKVGASAKTAKRAK